MTNSRKADPNWSFTVLLEREPTDVEFEAMFDAGLDDSTIESGPDANFMHMDRVAPTLLEAITSSVRDLHAAGGPRPIGVSLEEGDGVTLSDISDRLGGARTPESLRLLAAGKRGPGGFPRPLLDTGKLRISSWTEVATWLRDTLGETVPERSEVAQILTLADNALRLLEAARAAGQSEHIQRLLSA
jgi:hypothetical protein